MPTPIYPGRRLHRPAVRRQPGGGLRAAAGRATSVDAARGARDEPVGDRVPRTRRATASACAGSRRPSRSTCAATPRSPARTCCGRRARLPPDDAGALPHPQRPADRRRARATGSSSTFPADPPSHGAAPAGLAEALGVAPRWVGRSRFDYLVEVDSAEAVRALRPDLARLATLRGARRDRHRAATAAPLRLRLALLRAARPASTRTR